MKGPQDAPGGGSGESYNDNQGGGLFGGQGGGLFGGGQRQPQQPGSRAFHGDELPPEEGNAATQAWITNPALGTPTLSSANIPPTKAAIQHYQGIVAQGGWPMVPATVMKPGSTGQAIATLQRRLEVSGDLVGSSLPGEYDAAVVAAVKKFQTRHGLPPNGRRRQPGDHRCAERAGRRPPCAVAVQPEAAAELGGNGTLSLRRGQHPLGAGGSGGIGAGRPASRRRGGKAGASVARAHQQDPGNQFQSVLVRAEEHHLQGPGAEGPEFTRRGQDFLTAYHMQAFDAAGNPIDGRQINWNGTEVYNYQFRQLPWAENSLGYIKINFPNKDAVYMHDTPLKSLFGRAERFDSSGCVRVHNVDTLAAWILRDTPGWDINRIQSMKQTGEQVDVKLQQAGPGLFRLYQRLGLA